jgi:hypothetical protein
VVKHFKHKVTLRISESITKEESEKNISGIKSTKLS